jgi:predicted nucleic acid-binding Zn ribbon protein
MTNILLLSIETAKRDLMPEPLIYCANCGKPRVKGDYKRCCWCSQECYESFKRNYCIVCGKKINNNDFICSQECKDKNVDELWKKLKNK